MRTIGVHMNLAGSNLGEIDTRFRTALQRMAMAGRLRDYAAPVDAHLEIAALMKQQDGGPALWFSQVTGHSVPVVGNMLSTQENCEAAFGVDFRALRDLVGRALSGPMPPQLVQNAPVQTHVHRGDIDLGALLPVLQHTAADAGRYVTAGIVLARDPTTGIYNASYHRMLLVEPGKVAIKLDFGRHLRLAWERAQRASEDLPIVVCLGADLALHYTAATMGSQMPENADELAVAGGLAGRPIRVAKAVSQDLIVPADAEIIIEGKISTTEEVHEGPFGEFVGFLSNDGPAPVLNISAVTHRDQPIYHAINGYGRETIMLRKYVLEASLLRVLQAAVPIVIDAEMTAGGLHRFHAVVQVRKEGPMHDGLQRNAMMAAFGALKDLDQVIVVDEDIDIRDPLDVEYALATRFEASRDLLVIPGARGHEYVRAGNNGIRAKLGIDASVPFVEKKRFARCQFEPARARESAFVGPDAMLERIGDA
jgi:2,5-furandicarboxylate decarboxylase 1